MSKVTLFTAITTEDALKAIEAEASTYEGLHVEMSDPEQRKFVKGKLSEITDITKKVDRARIDLSKNFKKTVEDEAKAIKDRLDIASKPFSDLTDEWKAERQKTLDHKKAKEAEKQKELDHEDAIMHNKIFDIEKKEKDELLEKQIEEKRLADIAEVEQKAKQDLIDAENKRLADIEKIKQDAIDAQKKADEEKAAREANQAHVIATCKAAKESLMQHANLTEAQSIDAVNAIRANLILNVSIDF